MRSGCCLGRQKNKWKYVKFEKTILVATWSLLAHGWDGAVGESPQYGEEQKSANCISNCVEIYSPKFQKSNSLAHIVWMSLNWVYCQYTSVLRGRWDYRWTSDVLLPMMSNEQCSSLGHFFVCGRMLYRKTTRSMSADETRRWQWGKEFVCYKKTRRKQFKRN